MKKLLTTISTISLSLTLSLSLLLTPILTSPTLASEANPISNSSIIQTQLLTSTKTIKPTKVTLNKKTLQLNTGSSETLIPTISPSTVTNKSVTWKSSNTKIATVDSEGNIKGIKKGKATITVKTVDNKKTAKCIVTVIPIPIVNVTGISLNKKNTTINVGNSETLIATITPTNAINQTVLWDISDHSVATVDKNGKVTATKEGLTYVYATSEDGHKTVTCTVKVDNIITFKDKNLENAIRKIVNKPSGDLMKSDVSNITSLDVHSMEIVDISGIENLTNLTEIRLWDNKISDISPLKGLTNLTNINLMYNSISDLSALSSLSKLKFLSLNMNNINDTSPLSDLSNNLIHLYLNDNQISNIEPLKKLRYLEWLDLYGNKISDVDRISLSNALPKCTILYGDSIEIPIVITFPDANFEKAIRNSLGKQTGDITTSDVQKITKLSITSGNSISDISGIENLINLTEFSLSDSAVSDIGLLKGLTKLEMLNLGNNEITDISSLKNLSNLRVLSLSNFLPDFLAEHKNQISDISALSGLINLQSLEMKSNRISNIEPLKGLRKLWNLNLRDNLISEADKVALRKALPNCTLMYL